MVKNNKILIIFSLCLSFSSIKAASLNRQKRQTETDNDQAEIKKFHVNSRIQLRYAITNVETQMQNKHSEAKEVFFDMYIPKEAFVSNFTMTIKGKTYLASVETKEKAQNIYNESTDTSGLIQTTSQPEFTDGKQVFLSFFNFLVCMYTLYSKTKNVKYAILMCSLLHSVFFRLSIHPKFCIRKIKTVGQL